MAIKTNCHITAKCQVDMGFGRIVAASSGIVDAQSESRGILAGIKSISPPSNF